MNKKQTKEFLYPIKPASLYDGIQDMDEFIPDHPKLIETRKGKSIIVFQTNSMRGTMGVVVGWVLSKPRKAPGRDMMFVKVCPLTPSERKRYSRRFKKALNGHIEYWT